MADRPDAKEILRRLKLRPVAAAKPLTEAQSRLLVGGESRSGAGSKGPPEEVLQRQRAQVIREGEKPFELEEPSWLRALVERKATEEEVIEAMEKRLRRAPSRETLLAAKALAHDLAKRREGGPRLRKILTQELVNEIIQKGG